MAAPAAPLVWVLWAACFAAVEVAAAAAATDVRSRLVILEEGAQGGMFAVVRNEHNRHEPDVDEAACFSSSSLALAVPAADPMTKYTLLYRTGDVVCRVEMVADHPSHKGTRSEWKESAGDEDSWYMPAALSKKSEVDQGTFIKHFQLYALHLHPDVEEAWVHTLNGSVVAPVSLRARGASVMQDAGIVHRTLQIGGETTRSTNIVILSAGYQAHQVTQFNHDVTQIVTFLAGDRDFPLSRYHAMSNVFSVFQPSVEQGASVAGNTVDNNLRCRYGGSSEGATTARALQCSRDHSIALASTSPAKASLKNTMVVALVNSEAYGGTGLYSTSLRLATLYAFGLRTTPNLVTARSLFFHEAGHAFSDLSDEYTVAVTENGRNCEPPFANKRNPSLPLCEKNCAASTGNVWWQDLITAGKVPSPQPGCYFSNFYKPGTVTDVPCLMEKVSSLKLCPVCTEASILQLYENGMNLTSVACPHPEWATSYLALDASARPNGADSQTFFTSRKMYGAIANTGGGNKFDVKWYLNDALVQTLGDSYTVQASALGRGTHRLRLSIKDTTDAVQQKYRPAGMETETTWTIEVVSTYADLVAQVGSGEARTCDSGGTFRTGLPDAQYKYFAKCSDAAGACSVQYTTTTYDAPAEKSSAIDEIKGWILGLGGAMVATGICFFMLVYFIIVLYSPPIKKVMEDAFDRPIKYMRRILMVSNIFYMLAAVGIAVGLALVYNRISTLVKASLLVGLIFAVALFIAGLMGLVAAYAKKMIPNMISGIMHTLVFCAVLGSSALLLYVGYNCDNDGHSAADLLRDEWYRRVREDPGTVCTAQQDFECSGWDVPCNRIESPSNCPRDCEDTNGRYADTCKVVITSFVHKWLPLTGSMFLLLAYLLLCGCLLVFMMFYVMNLSRKLENTKIELLREGPIEGLLSIVRLHRGDKASFYNKLEEEFERFDQDGDGFFDKLEFSEFFRQSLGVELTEEQLDLLFALIDLSGDNLISYKEWKDVLTKTCLLSDEDAIDYLSERKERAAMKEDLRRQERMEQIDDDETNGIALDEDNEFAYDQAFCVYGRLDDESFETLLAEFREIAKADKDGVPLVHVADFKQHLQKRFKLNLSSRKAQAVIEGLPQLIDKENAGVLSWTDWCATYFIRRDCYMELVKKKKQIVRNKELTLTGFKSNERSRMQSMRTSAQRFGMSFHNSRRQSAGDLNGTSRYEPRASMMKTSPDFDGVGPAAGNPDGYSERGSFTDHNDSRGAL